MRTFVIHHVLCHIKIGQIMLEYESIICDCATNSILLNGGQRLFVILLGHISIA